MVVTYSTSIGSMSTAVVENPEKEKAIRLKIDKIADRTENTTLPKLDHYWSNQKPFGGEMSKLLVDRMIFSSSPDAREGGAVALTAFLMNSRNRNALKNAGSLGACLEILYRTDIRHTADSAHISNLVRSLYTLLENDKQMQERLFLHPHGINLLNQLCKYCRAKDQQLAMEILKFLSQLKGGLESLLQHKCLDMLMSPELLYHSKTVLSVRHSAAILIHRLVEYSPKSLSVSKLASVTLDLDGQRKIDGYTEIQLLHAFLCYVDDLAKENQRLPEVFSLLSHLIDEIKSETFESLDHMQLIIRCILVASEDPKQVDFMLLNGLCTAMQYVVRTDFLLFKKKTVDLKSVGQSSISSIRTRLISLQRGSKNNSKEGMNRSLGTLMALSMVMPELPPVKSRNFDINISATQCALLIYENIINQRIELVNEIISSGTIPALLHRVGRGQATNERFNKPVIRFLHFLLHRVMLVQTHRGEHMAMVSRSRSWGAISAKARVFTPMGSLSRDHIPEGAHHQSSGVLAIRVISNTLHVLSVTPLLFSNLNMTIGLDMSVTSDTINCLSFLCFPMIAKEICQPDNLCSLLHLYNAHRGECFFPALSLLCDIIPYCTATGDDASISIIIENKGLKLLVRALQVSGRIFPMKSAVYCCIALLAKHTRFYDRLVFARGVSTVAGETRARRFNMRNLNRKERAEVTEELRSLIEGLESILAPDIFCVTIQAAIRGFLLRKTKGKRRRVLVKK